MRRPVVDAASIRAIRHPQSTATSNLVRPTRPYGPSSPPCTSIAVKHDVRILDARLSSTDDIKRDGGGAGDPCRGASQAFGRPAPMAR